MRVMISQPMRGLSEDTIIKNRKLAEAYLELQGHTIVDTVFHDFPELPPDSIAIGFLAKSIDFIAKVDGVAFLHGFEKARGCVIENEIAKQYGKWVLELPEVFI